jgi:dCTP deaminase
LILSDLEIAKRLADRTIVITPLLDPVAQIGPSSVDVRLGTEFRVPFTSHIAAVDPYKKGEAQRYMRPVEVPLGEEFFLHPGDFTLASTLEYVRIPHDLACRLEGRSSWGRLGLVVHATAGFVDPGYAGILTFELYNAGRLPIPLRPGRRMAQLCFFTLTGKPQIPYDRRPQSKYYRSLGPEASRISRDE